LTILHGSFSNEKPFNPFEGIEMPGLDDDPISDKPSNRNGDQRIAGNDAGVFDFNVPSTSDKAKNTRLCDRCGCPLRHNVKGFCA
jgi:hypothetical protein